MSTKRLPPEFGEPEEKKENAGRQRELTRRDFVKIAGAVGAAATVGELMSTSAAAQRGGKPKLSTPVLSCASSTENTIELQVCAGTTGAPAGFSVQWMTCADYEANGNVWYDSDDSRLCKASFSGNANGTRWNLAAGECADVVIGGLNDADPGVSFTCNDPLACETCYVFRAFAHATSSNQRSDFTANKQCTTDACAPPDLKDGDFCTRSQGFFGGSGAAGRDALIACFGGDPTGAACTTSAGTSLVTIGGGTYTYAWTTTGTCTDVQGGPGVFLVDDGLLSLRAAVGGGGPSGYFTANGNNAANMGAGGGLASQVAALTLNLGCVTTPNDCPYASGGNYAALKLCKFAEGDTFKNDGSPISAATALALNGQTVADVLAAANAYLGGNGAVPVPYSLSNAADLNELVANLNLAFDQKDWDGDGTDDCACGGMTAFAESHLCL